MTREEARAQLHVGGEYEIRHQRSDQRYARKSRMSYLGEYDGSFQFNARPVAGTQDFSAEQIKAIQFVGASAGRDDPNRYVNRRA
jgi:hypothetical protein